MEIGADNLRTIPVLSRSTPPLDPMSFRLRFPTLFTSFAAAAEVARPTYWGRCPHCEQTTPWQVNALRGRYRCTACGRSALGG